MFIYFEMTNQVFGLGRGFIYFCGEPFIYIIFIYVNID
jgi:hypothetical protein